MMLPVPEHASVGLLITIDTVSEVVLSPELSVAFAVMGYVQAEILLQLKE